MVQEGDDGAIEDLGDPGYEEEGEGEVRDAGFFEGFGEEEEEG